MVRRILVPIDGSRSSTSVIPYVAELAKGLGCRVDLVLVESEGDAGLPHPAHQGGESGKLVVGAFTPEQARSANEHHVARHIEEFEVLGVEANGHIRRGKPVEEILSAALELRCDMIGMTTLHRGRFARSDSGSVAEEVAWRSRLPVLLVAEG
jgi:nucleotide-binding universal stress UspA family protein